MSVMYRSCNNKREDTEEGGKVSIGMRQGGGGGHQCVCVWWGGEKRERGGGGVTRVADRELSRSFSVALGSWPAMIGSMKAFLNIVLVPSRLPSVAQFTRAHNSSNLFWINVPLST